MYAECNLACMFFHDCELFMFTFNYNNVFRIQSSITCGGFAVTFSLRIADLQHNKQQNAVISYYT